MLFVRGDGVILVRLCQAINHLEVLTVYGQVSPPLRS